jgi:hypothetical protein
VLERELGMDIADGLDDIVLCTPSSELDKDALIDSDMLLIDVLSDDM